MREIKFRAWIVDGINDPYMAKVDGIDWKYGTVHTYGVKHQTEQELKWCHLIQYTGLKDKNGKEIYEGDVVCTSLVHKQKDCPYPDNFHRVIEYIDGAYTIINPANGYEYGERPSRIEVIGNIYETPELIK